MAEELDAPQVHQVLFWARWWAYSPHMVFGTEIFCILALIKSLEMFLHAFPLLPNLDKPLMWWAPPCWVSNAISWIVLAGSLFNKNCFLRNCPSWASIGMSLPTPWPTNGLHLGDLDLLVMVPCQQIPVEVLCIGWKCSKQATDILIDMYVGKHFMHTCRQGAHCMIVSCCKLSNPHQPNKIATSPDAWFQSYKFWQCNWQLVTNPDCNLVLTFDLTGSAMTHKPTVRNGYEKNSDSEMYHQWAVLEQRIHQMRWDDMGSKGRQHLQHLCTKKRKHWEYHWLPRQYVLITCHVQVACLAKRTAMTIANNPTIQICLRSWRHMPSFNHHTLAPHMGV